MVSRCVCVLSDLRLNCVAASFGKSYCKGVRSRVPSHVTDISPVFELINSVMVSLPSQPLICGSEGCARVTGKAGENGQHSGETGGSSP